MANWVKMSTLLKPRLGDRFALVRDNIDDVMLLINLNNLLVVMTDNETEKRLCKIAVEKARGDVLVIGFGLGMILIPMMKKPEVNSVTVLEIEQEVLDLVASQLKLNEKVNIVLADALDWQTDRKFDFIWSDADFSPESSQNYFWHDSNYSKVEFASMRFKSWLKDGGTYLEYEVNNG